jgi:hypothetical protein
MQKKKLIDDEDKVESWNMHLTTICSYLHKLTKDNWI